MRLSPDERQRVLERLNQPAHGKPAVNKRKHHRWSYTRVNVPVLVEHPGGSTSRILVDSRNLSAGGLSFLHASYLYKGSKCVVLLVDLNGKPHLMRSEIVACRHIDGMVHEIGLRFQEQIDPEKFVSAEAMAEEGGPDQVAVAAPKLDASLLALIRTPSDEGTLRQVAEATGSRLKLVDKLTEITRDLAGNFDVMVLDSAAGHEKVVEVIDRLRAEEYEGHIIVLTSAKECVLAEKIDADVNCRAVAKPFSAAEFTTVIKEFLGDDETADLRHSVLENQPEGKAVVQKFIEQARAKGEQLAEAIEKQSIDEVTQICRALSTEGGGAGFSRLAGTAGDVISAIEAGQKLEDIKDELDHLCLACAKLHPREAVKAKKPPDQDAA